MHKKWIEESFTYDGSQLRSLYAYMNWDLLGDSIISWQGPCEITLEHMIDGEDLKEQSKIASKNMLHFIIEKFDISLFSAVCLQRMMSELVVDLITEMSPLENLKFQRRGDDLYFNDRKLNISIATKSPVSSLIHYGLNITNEGTPVPTASLSDFQIEPKNFALQFMNHFGAEVAHITQATQKVRGAL